MIHSTFNPIQIENINLAYFLIPPSQKIFHQNRNCNDNKNKKVKDIFRKKIKFKKILSPK